ncbi:MAG: hypothetical protein GXX84_10135 [Acidobacteria bacterium]|nr:hypothetical protein [Acidobacteriota bacterium]
MENHPHTVLRTRPDILASWSNHDVAARWLRLFPQKRNTAPLEQQIQRLAELTERISVLRKRLCSVSWFMAQLNEFIARKANKEDNVKGRFWESRFKCQVLLDEAATASCMVYVDLNPIRAGLASTPENSDFTSIQERIRAWRKKIVESSPDTDTAKSTQPLQQAFAADIPPQCQKGTGLATPEMVPATDFSPGSQSHTDSWLCPIQSDARRRGILQMSETEYFALLDRSGRMIRADKPGFIDASLEPILHRIGAIPEAWNQTVSHFGSAFRLAAGKLSRMREFADRVEKTWFTGLSAARSAFT